jgi:hypothetical protein
MYFSSVFFVRFFSVTLLKHIFTLRIRSLLFRFLLETLASRSAFISARFCRRVQRRSARIRRMRTRKTLCAVIVVCALAGFFAPPFLMAQTAPSADESQELERVLEFLAQDSDAATIIDLLEYYHLRPLNLKTASSRDIQTLPGFSLKLALSLRRFLRVQPKATLEHIRDSLDLNSAQAFVLQYCTNLGAPPSLDLDGAESPEVVAGLPVEKRAPRDSTKVFTSSSRSSGPSSAQSAILAPLRAKLWYRARTRARAVPQRGLTADATESQRFQGSAFEWYQRLTVFTRVDSAWNIEANITTDKDAGELSLLDFVSAFLRAEFKSGASWTSALVGDFIVESGQGVVLWSIFSPRKGGEVLQGATQMNARIFPYRSSTEQQFFRGVSVEHDRAFADGSSLRAAAWASRQNRAARYDSVRNVVTSLDFAGLFRTRSELSLRGNLLEQVYGGTAEYSSPASADKSNAQWSVGASAMYLEYDKEVTSRSVMVFPLRQGVIASVFGSFSRENILLTGEIARDGEGNVGARLGGEAKFEDARFAATARWFPAAFRSPFGVNFGEASKPTNEAGLYMGASLKLSSAWRILSYCDLYGSIEPTATVPEPVRGADVFVEAVGKIAPEWQTIIRARHETKTDAMTIGSGRNSVRVAYGRGRTSLRLHADYALSESVRLQARAEGALIGYEGYAPEQLGALGFVGFSWKPSPFVSLAGRCVLYKTDSFDSALWQYEAALPGTMSNPALFGEGLRAYLLAEWRGIPECTISVRGSLTNRFDASVISSGANQINSNADAQIAAQVEIRL